MHRRSLISHGTLLAVGLSLPAVGAAGASSVPVQAPQTPDVAAPSVETQHRDRAFERFLTRYEAANSAFLNGDPTPWRAITSHHEPVSIVGGLGDAGVQQVNRRYALAASAFKPSGAIASFQYLVKDVQGKLAYTVAIERAEVVYAGRTARSLQVLRVTMVFRAEHGDWRIIHRHADPMIALNLPS